MSLQVEIKDNKIKAPVKGKNKWLVLRPEEEVRQKYICILVNKYGFSLEQMEQEVLESNNEHGLGGARADIIVYKNESDKKKRKNAVIVVECKADKMAIHIEDYFQGANYAAMCNATFFVTTNFKETKIFKVVSGEIPKQLEEVINIPDAKIINDEKEINALLKKTKAFTIDEFSRLLFKCHNIIRNNDKLSPEAALDEIIKILFIKIHFKRTNSEYQIFSKETFKQDKAYYEKYKTKEGIDFYQFLFAQTIQDFRDNDLFVTNEIIRISENSFEAIVEELENYNLSTTSDDVKGIAFEQFLGKTFRGELGQFFTPRTIVDFIVEILDPQEGEIICDPCCGSGGFLIKAFEYVRAKIEKEIHMAKVNIKADYYDEAYEKKSDSSKVDIDEKVNQLFNVLNEELDINIPKSRLRELSYDRIFGTDVNPSMSRTAKMNMIMHGCSHGGVHHNDGLLNVNGIFENRFDVILTNPPFGSRVENSLKITEADKYTDQVRIKKYQERFGNAYNKALKQVNDNIDKSLLSLFETGTISSLTEVLFIERCLNLLKPGGRMGIVLSEEVLNNTNLQKIRDFVESKAKILLITSIHQDLFIANGSPVKPSLLFLKKFTEEESQQWISITNKAQQDIRRKYEIETKFIEGKIDLRSKEALSSEEKKQLKAALRIIEDKINMEVKAQIKKEFNYQIPIADVEKAGISTTGAPIDNDLEPLAKEFAKYRVENNLWGTKFNKIQNEIMGKGKIYPIPIAANISIASEPENFL